MYHCSEIYHDKMANRILIQATCILCTQIKQARIHSQVWNLLKCGKLRILQSDRFDNHS